MEVSQETQPSLDDRIRQQLQRNRQRRQEQLEGIRAANERFEALAALDRVWYTFGTRSLFPSDTRSIADCEHEAAIDDVLRIGQALDRLGLLPRVAEWGQPLGLSGAATVDIVRAAADGDRAIVAAQMQQLVFDQTCHTADFEPYHPDDLTAVYSHLAAALPTVLGMPFTRVGTSDAPPEWSVADEAPAPGLAAAFGELPAGGEPDQVSYLAAADAPEGPPAATPDPPPRTEPAPDLTGPAELLAYGRKHFKGYQLALLEALCGSEEPLPIADLRVREGLGWDDPLDGFKNARRGLNEKIQCLGWKVERHNNAGRLVKLPKTA